jgi:hypothetical protein
MAEQKYISFDRPMLRRFKAAYEKACKKCQDEGVSPSEEVFMFEENEFLVSYAKYLIQYLETKFKAM